MNPRPLSWRLPVETPPPATTGAPPSRAVLPPLDEEAMWADYRAGEAERLAHLPHVRQVLRTAEALAPAEDVPHPLGRHPDLWAVVYDDGKTPAEEARDSMRMLGWVILIAAIGYAVIAAWLGWEAYDAIREAMDLAAAEAIARRAM